MTKRLNFLDVAQSTIALKALILFTKIRPASSLLARPENK